MDVWVSMWTYEDTEIQRLLALWTYEDVSGFMVVARGTTTSLLISASYSPHTNINTNTAFCLESVGEGLDFPPSLCRIAGRHKEVEIPFPFPLLCDPIPVQFKDPEAEFARADHPQNQSVL